MHRIELILLDVKLRRVKKVALVKRPEQDELGPVLEPFTAKYPPLSGSEPVAAGDHAQLK